MRHFQQLCKRLPEGMVLVETASPIASPVQGRKQAQPTLWTLGWTKPSAETHAIASKVPPATALDLSHPFTLKFESRLFHHRLFKSRQTLSHALPDLSNQFFKHYQWEVDWWEMAELYSWLVVYLPVWKIWVRQLGWWNSQYMEQ